MSVGEPEGGPAGGMTGGPRAEATVLRMLVGNQLRRLREAAGVSPDDAGYEIRASRSKISRMENGRVSFKDRDIADLLTLYKVSDEAARERIAELARQANTPGWWAKYGDIVPDWFEVYLGLEAAASVIRTFELQFVHGLFQTEDYARAVTRLGHQSASAADIDRRVSVRIKRQDILASPTAPRVWSVMDEAALRRPAGNPRTMRAQLTHLTHLATAPNITLQIVPFGHGAHAAAGGSFTILRFAEPDLPDVVYIEQLTSALYLESPTDLDHYMETMNRLSAEALTPTATIDYLHTITRQT